jgi:hypothetical protein
MNISIDKDLLPDDEATDFDVYNKSNLCNNPSAHKLSQYESQINLLLSF